MSGSANTSALSTPMNTASSVASLASGPTMLAECKQAILHLGGTWPPVGTKTTSDRSASRATFTDKENSGFLAAILTASTKAELIKLCAERTRLEGFRLGSYTRYRTTTKNSTCSLHESSEWQPDPKTAARIEELRTKRLECFRWFAEATKRWTTYQAENKYGRKREEFDAICHELYELTGDQRYKR